MSRLKSTVKVNYSSAIGGAQVREEMRRSYRFVFSSNIRDWQFTDTQFGRNRRKAYENELRSIMKLEKPETNNVKKAA
jgi:hypothetical protein